MTSATADVSVVIPVHNRQDLVGASIASARRQVPRPREILVVDDGSSDGTVATARRAGATVLPNTQMPGSGGARNTGIEAATSTYIALLDSDDEWLSGHVASLLAAATPDTGLVTASGIGTRSGRLLGSRWPRPSRLDHTSLFWPSPNVVTSGCLLVRQVALEVGGFRPLTRAQDLDLWVRVLAAAEGRTTGRVTVRYREHEGQTTVDLAPTRATVLTLLEEYAQEDWCTPLLRRRVTNLFRWDGLVDERSLERLRLYLHREGAPTAALDLVHVAADRRVRRVAGRLAGG